jgi:FkbM family methyltransferase
MHLSEFLYTVLLKPAPLRRAANALIKAMLPRTVSVGGSVICINPDDPVVSGALTLRVYEKAEIAFFRRHFRRDMTFIDVGANVGLYTGLAIATPGFCGKIIAVEPHEESRRFLRQTIAANDRAGLGEVVIDPRAASNGTGSIRLFKNAGNKGDNRIYADSLLAEEETIEADTLDRICAAHGVHSAQFVKIDVQGAEPKVIAGAAALLGNSANCILMTEFWPYGITSCGEDALDYFASLLRLGFCLHELDGRALRLVPIESGEELVRRNPGRRYTNLIGLKGEFAGLAPARSQ